MTKYNIRCLFGFHKWQYGLWLRRCPLCQTIETQCHRISGTKGWQVPDDDAWYMLELITSHQATYGKATDVHLRDQKMDQEIFNDLEKQR